MKKILRRLKGSSKILLIHFMEHLYPQMNNDERIEPKEETTMIKLGEGHYTYIGGSIYVKVY